MLFHPDQMKTGIYIAIWILFSSCTILFNKWILGFFPYPIFLTTWHMFFASVGTFTLKKTTNLLNSLDENPISNQVYFSNVVPIGVFFAASLIFSNKVYLYLSVSFIQMLKAATPIVVLLLSFVMNLEKPSAKLFAIIFLVSSGIAIASYGEIDFIFIGVLFQVLGIVVESIRLVLVQILLSNNGLKFDAICGLYLFAPVTFFFEIFLSIYSFFHSHYFLLFIFLSLFF